MRPLCLAFLAAVLSCTSVAFAFEQTWQDPETYDEGLTVEQFALALDELGSPYYVVRRRARSRIIDRANAEVLFALYQVRERVADPEIASSLGYIIPAVRKKVGDSIYEKDFLMLGPFPFPDGMEPKGNADRRDWLELPTGLDALNELNLSEPVPAFPVEEAEPAAKDTKKEAAKKAEDQKAEDQAEDQGEEEDEPGLSATWQRPFKGKRGMIDFAQLYKKRKQYANVLLVTFVYSDRDARAELWMGSDDGLAVWINGACVHARDVQRGIAHDSDRVEIHLKKGWNPAVFRVSQGWGGWSFSMRLTDLSGSPWPAKWLDPEAGGQAPQSIPITKPYHAIDLGTKKVKQKGGEVTRPVCAVRLPAHWHLDTSAETARKDGKAEVTIDAAHYLDPNATRPARLTLSVGAKEDAKADKAEPEAPEVPENPDELKKPAADKTRTRTAVTGAHAVTLTLSGPTQMVEALEHDLTKLVESIEKQ